MGKYAINAAEKPPFRGLKRPYSANNLLAVSSISITLKVYPEVQSQMRKHQPRMCLSCLNKKIAVITQKPSASN